MTVSGSWVSRVRVGINKTATKGYTAETTAELSWTEEGPDLSEEAQERLQALLSMADNLARQEVARREYLDDTQ